jgi:hypothetical protein
MEPVVSRSVDTSDDVADRRVWARIEAIQSSTPFVCDTSHTRDGAFAILGAVKEVVARVVLRHAEQRWRDEVAVEDTSRFMVIQKFPSATQQHLRPTRHSDTPEV